MSRYEKRPWLPKLFAVVNLFQVLLRVQCVHDAHQVDVHNFGQIEEYSGSEDIDPQTGVFDKSIFREGLLVKVTCNLMVDVVTSH